MLYSRVRNTSVTLEPRLSQKSIKILGVLANLKTQKSSVQGRPRRSHSCGFNSAYEDIVTSLKHHTTVLELNKKNKTYSINPPKAGELDFKSNLILCRNKVQLQNQKHVLNILMLHHSSFDGESLRFYPS